MTDRPWAFDIREDNGFARLEAAVRSAFTALAQITRGLSALSGRAGWVFKGDRAGFQRGIESERLVDDTGERGSGDSSRNQCTCSLRSNAYA
jgi:hypothetical protein